MSFFWPDKRLGALVILWACAFGQAEAQLADSQGDPLPAGAVARLGTVRYRLGETHYEPITFSPSGKLLAIDGQIYEGESGRPIQSYVSAQRTNAAFGPDERTFWTADEHEVSVWDLRTRERLRVMSLGRVCNGTSISIALSPDRKTMAVGCALRGPETEGVVYRWDVASGRQLPPLKNGNCHTNAIAWSADSRWLAVTHSTGNDTGLTVWSVAEPKIVFRSPGELLRAPVFRPNGAQLAVEKSNNDGMKLWDTEGWKLREVPEEHGKHAFSGPQTYSPGGEWLAVGGSQHVSLFRAADLARERVIAAAPPPPGGEKEIPGHFNRVRRIGFAPNGRLFVASDDLALRVYDPSTGLQVAGPRGWLSGVRSLAYSADGESLATAGGRGSEVWDARTWKLRRAFGAVTDPVAFSADGKQLLGSSRAHALGLWDAASGEPARMFPAGDNQTVWHVSGLGDGVVLAAGKIGEVPRVWRAAPGERLRTIFEDHLQASGAAISADGRWLATQHEREDRTVAKDGQVRLWRISGPQLQMAWGIKVPGEYSRVSALRFSPDSKSLAIAGSEDAVHLADVDTGKLSETWKVLGAGRALAFSADGRFIAASDAEKGVILWHRATGVRLASLRGHRDDIEALAFSPDTRRLVSGSRDTTALVWNLEPILAGASDEALAALAAGQKLLDEQPQQAMERFQEAVKLAPDLPMARHLTGFARVQLHDNRQAALDLDRAIELHPAYAQSYAVRACARSRLGAYAGALADAQRSLELEPIWLWLHDLRNEVLIRQGRLDEALVEINLAVDKYDRYWNAPRSTRARLFIAQGKLDEAIEDCEASLATKKGAAAYALRGYARGKKGQWGEALGDLSEAHAQDRFDPEILEWRSQAYEKLGKPDEARADRQRAETIRQGSKDKARSQP